MHSEIVESIENFAAQRAFVALRGVMDVGNVTFGRSRAAESLAADVAYHLLYVT